MARRPTFVDNFGDDLGEEAFAFVDAVYRGAEPQPHDGGRYAGARYVVAQRGEAFLSESAGPGSFLRALFVRDGSGAYDGERAQPPLAHHRLVFESRGIRWSDPEAEAVFKVFEVVRGATIEGRTRPGGRVRLELGVYSNRGRRLVYQAEATGDEDGRYRLPAPYANDATPPGMLVAPLYRLTCGDQVRAVAVSDERVRAGARVQGPVLCAGGTGPAGVATSGGSG